MEALLLSLDVLCAVLLLRAVVKSAKSGDHKDLGIFRYRDSPPPGATDTGKLS